MSNDTLRPADAGRLDQAVKPLTWMPVLVHPLAIRAALLDRAQAEINHGQTLEKLAERGGLSLSEAAALAQQRRWRMMTNDEALAELRQAAECPRTGRAA